jgi:ribosomal protein S18 acetylase RimI-like enzyme
VGIAANLALIASEPEDWILTEPPVDIPARAAQMRESLEHGDGASWVLVDADGVIAGSLGMYAEEPGGPLYFGMGVARELRGGGWGKRLLDTALAFADEAGRSVVLEVYADNARAIRLYEGRGFAVTAELPQHFLRRSGIRRDALRMERPPRAHRAG